MFLESKLLECCLFESFKLKILTITLQEEDNLRNDNIKGIISTGV